MPGKVKRFSVFMVAAMALLFSAKSARAEGFSSTALLYEYAGNLRDPYYGNNAVDGAVTTVTLEHFGEWALGDNFFFLDMLSGRMADFGGADAYKSSRLYAEWGPRVSFSKAFGVALPPGAVKDLFLAGQFNRDGEGFMAEMFGVGADFAVPGFNFVSLNLYSRKDNFNSRTHQLTASWGADFRLAGADMLFEGHFDFAGTDNNGEDVNSQPRLFVDMSRLAGAGRGALLAGVEWYYHQNNNFTQNVPQWTLKWVW